MFYLFLLLFIPLFSFDQFHLRSEFHDIIEQEIQRSYEPEFSLAPIISAPTYQHLMELAEDPIALSSFFEVGRNQLKCGRIMFINGILNQLDDAINHAILLSNYASKVKIYGIHNKTHSAILDFPKCYANTHGIPTLPSFLLLKKMIDFHKTRPLNEKMLIINTSGGAIHLKNALRMASQEVRNRIISLSIAPAAIITQELCYEAHTYAIKEDPVVIWAIANDPQSAPTIQFVKSNSTILQPEHSISSPVYETPLRNRMDEYINIYGSKK